MIESSGYRRVIFQTGCWSAKKKKTVGAEPQKALKCERTIIITYAYNEITINDFFFSFSFRHYYY